MAAKKKVAPQMERSRAYEHGNNAFGAKYLKPGAALTPELDLKFALGHGSGVAPITLLPDLKPGKKAKHHDRELARNVALAELRKPPNTPFGAQLELEENPDPLEPDEAKAILKRRLPSMMMAPQVLRSVEAMIGPTAALAAVMEGVEATKDQGWNNGGTGKVIFPLYGLLLRTPEEESNAARKRLEAVYEKWKGHHGAKQLGIMLGGREAIRRIGYKYSLKFKSYQRNEGDEPSNVHDLCFCDGESDWIASQFAALWEAFKYKVQNHMNGPAPARLFFLAGDKALETELKVVGQYPGTKQGEAFDSYKDLRSPLVVQLMKALAGPKSKVKAKAEEWLGKNG
jgi:hypothetical protein